MNSRNFLMRVVSRLPGIPSDLFDWWTESREIAAEAQRQRVEDEARITTNPQDMSRWITTPNGRRKRPHWNGGTR